MRRDFAGFVLEALLLFIGCSAAPATIRPDGARCPGAPTFLFEHGAFDGRTLSGKALIGASDREIFVHPLAMTSAAFFVHDVVDCSTHERVPFMNADIVGGCAKEHDCDPLRLRRGYWYGSDLRLAVVDGPPRSCVEVELRLVLPTQEPRVPDRAIRVKASLSSVEVIWSDPCNQSGSSELRPE